MSKAEIGRWISDVYPIFHWVFSIILPVGITWLTLKYKIGRQLDASITQEKLSRELEKNNQILSLKLSNYASHLQNSHDKRIEAVDALWLAILAIRESMPTPVPLCLSFLKDDELTNESIDKSKLKGMLQQIDLDKIAEDSVPLVKRIKEVRPYISQDLFSNAMTYYTFVHRVIYKIVDGYKKGNLITWKSDLRTKEMLKSALEDKEVRAIYDAQFSGFFKALDFLERKIISKMQSTISGQDASIDSSLLFFSPDILDLESQRKKEGFE